MMLDLQLPLHIVTGFLGSGKTTLISSFLAGPTADGTAVLVNELGEVGIDDQLMEHVAEDVQLMGAGCLCCALRDDLAEGLRRLRKASEISGRRIRRVLLETSGIADPAPIVAAIHRDPRVAGVISDVTLVAIIDAPRALSLLDEQPEVERQLDLADRIGLTKVDLAAPDLLETTLTELETRFGGRELVLCDPALENLMFLIAPTLELQDARQSAQWLKPIHTGDPGVDQRSFELEGPVHLDALHLWQRLVTGLDGRKLLRIKGIVETTNGLFVLQSAQHTVFPPRALPQRPKAWAGSKLVIASRDLQSSVLDGMERAARLAATGSRMP